MSDLIRDVAQFLMDRGPGLFADADLINPLDFRVVLDLGGPGQVTVASSASLITPIGGVYTRVALALIRLTVQIPALYNTCSNVGDKLDKEERRFIQMIGPPGQSAEQNVLDPKVRLYRRGSWVGTYGAGYFNYSRVVAGARITS